MFFKKKVSLEVWTETMICLYERQMAARDAMGRKWKCHPMNAQPRIIPSKAQPYIGYDVVNIPTVFPPKLRLVK